MKDSKRFNPLLEEELIITSTEKIQDDKKIETAKHNSLDSVETCPICNNGKPLPVLSCNGIPAHVCRTHRIAFPTRDN